MSEETPVEVVETNEPSAEQAAVEKEASVYGWVPLEKFRGNEDEWVDADTFVKRGKEINPILRKNNEILLKKLEQSQVEIAEVKRVAQEFREFQKETTARKVAELESQLTALKEAKRDAINAGNGEQVIAIDDAIDELKTQRDDAKKATIEVKTTPAAEAVLDPVVKEWIGKHEWFGVNKKLTVLANAVAEEVRSNYPHLQGKDFFDKLDEQLEEEPQFGKKPTPRQNPVEGAGGGRGATSVPQSKRSYNNLPAEAKTACDKYVKNGLLTREQYVAYYAWD